MINRKTIAWLVAVIWVAIALILWLAVLGPSNLPVIIAEPAQAEIGPEGGTSDPEEQGLFAVHNATPENLYRLGEAVMAFTTADLDLPTLDVRFHSDRGPCDGYHGVFRTTSESKQVRICSSDIQTVYEHELAHAWVTANVSDTQRSAFMNLRGLEHWVDRDIPWNQRGTEWAAVIIQQGVNGLPLPPALSNETKSRLQSYELLTGRVAPILVDWIKERDVPCKGRPTNLSRPTPDRTGRSCFHPVLHR